MLRLWWGICIWLCYKFPTESNSERILKIGQYFVKLWARVWCLCFFLTHGVFSDMYPLGCIFWTAIYNGNARWSFKSKLNFYILLVKKCIDLSVMCCCCILVVQCHLVEVSRTEVFTRLAFCKNGSHCYSYYIDVSPPPLVLKNWRILMKQSITACITHAFADSH